MTDVTEALADLDMAHDLICEAKGADGPNGGFVTDHLDAADHWIGKVRDYLEAARIPAPASVDRDDLLFAADYISWKRGDHTEMGEDEANRIEALLRGLARAALTDHTTKGAK